MQQPRALTLGSVARFCWRRPRLWARELLWRSLYGVFALLLIALACWQIFHLVDSFLLLSVLHRITRTPDGQFMPSVENLSMLSLLASLLKPAILAVAKWLLPLFTLGWAVAFGFGRMSVLRAYDPELKRRAWALAGLQALRLLALAVLIALWWQGVAWAARSAVHYGYSGSGLVGDLFGYFVWVSLFTLAALLVWTLINWLFPSVVCLLVLGRLKQFRAILPLPLRHYAPLTQAGFGLALVRLALAGLSMLVSALPALLGILGTGWALYGWWIAVSLAYLVISAFWAVVRQGVWLDFQKSIFSAGLSNSQNT